MHHDVRRWVLLGRCPRAAQPNVSIGVHRERGHEVITVGVIDKAFLQEGATLRPDLTPKHAAPRVEGALGLVAGEEAAAVLIDAKSPGAEGMRPDLTPK